MPVSDTRIVLHLNIHEPIELTELTLSFSSLASQYRRHLVDEVRARGGTSKDVEAKLYITKIENNCILAEIAGATDVMGALFSVMDYTNIFCQFVRNINMQIEYFANFPKKDAKTITAADIPSTKKECSDIADFLQVVAGKGELGLSVASFEQRDGEKETLISFTYDSATALKARRGSLLAQDIFEQRGDADHKNAVMYFQQTNTEESKTEGRTGERAIIKELWPKPLRVYIVSNLDREKIMSHKANPSVNPLQVSYIVDVNVETNRYGNPIQYRVIRLVDIIQDGEDVAE